MSEGDLVQPIGDHKGDQHSDDHGQDLEASAHEASDDIGEGGRAERGQVRIFAPLALDALERPLICLPS